MKDNSRQYPVYSLCGLNCGLCPRYHTEGPSRCPGCGGADFSQKHPACAVITCNKKHDNVQFCFECGSYPCPKYQSTSAHDSFISYTHVLQNFNLASQDLAQYLSVLKRKQDCLTILLQEFNDGRSKGLYCLAIDLLPAAILDELQEYIEDLRCQVHPDPWEKAHNMAAWIRQKAEELKIALQLRK